MKMSSRKFVRRWVGGVSAVTLSVAVWLVALAGPASAAGGLVVNDLDHGSTALGLAQSLAGPGVTISNVAFTGANNAAGTFSGGTGIVGFDSGLVMGTGSVQTQPNAGLCAKGVEGPNTCDSNTTSNSAPGDPQLDTLAGVPTNDAAVLQFDFVPAASKIQFSYIFSSDEYPEFANTAFNDTFAFFVNNQNCALVPNTNLPVSVNTINGGNPLGTNPQNSQFYVDNHFVDSATPSALNTEMDGLTTVLTCSADVTAGQTNHMKLAIADGSDSVLDSNVFLKADSLTSGTQIATSLSGGSQSGKSITVPAGTAVSDTATLTGTNISTAGGTVGYTQYTNSTCTDGATSAGTKTVTNGVVPASDALTPTAGTYYWQASYSGDASNNAVISGCDEVLTVTPVAVNQPPVLTPANGSVQYSDAITPFNVTGTDPENDPLTLTASGLPANLIFTDNHNGTGTVSGTATATPAVYTVTYSASDGTNPPVTATATVTVTKEDCTLTMPSTVLSSATGPTVLKASMGEPDASLGDRSNKTITFAGLDSSLTPVGPFTATTDASGNASASAALGAGVYTINAAFAGDAFYNPCATTSDTIVTVSPAGFKVTGGGWISNGVGRTSFGFNAVSDVTGLHGQLQIRTQDKGNFHGNVVLTLSGTANTAQWTGNGSWNGVSGYKFTVAVVDAGTSGKKGDTISITIMNPAGTSTVFNTGGSVPLKGGNIVVH